VGFGSSAAKQHVQQAGLCLTIVGHVLLLSADVRAAELVST
jgi:hypothetical protein